MGFLDNWKHQRRLKKEEKRVENERLQLEEFHRKLLNDAGDIVKRMYYAFNDFNKQTDYYTNKYEDNILIMKYDAESSSGWCHEETKIIWKGYGVVYEKDHTRNKLYTSRYGDWLKHFQELYQKMLDIEEEKKKANFGDIK
jgi:hypothetical protein